jgi:hypothetical protein
MPTATKKSSTKCSGLNPCQPSRPPTSILEPPASNPCQARRRSDQMSPASNQPPTSNAPTPKTRSGVPNRVVADDCQ